MANSGGPRVERFFKRVSRARDGVSKGCAEFFSLVLNRLFEACLARLVITTVFGLGKRCMLEGFE